MVVKQIGSPPLHSGCIWHIPTAKLSFKCTWIAGNVFCRFIVLELFNHLGNRLVSCFLKTNLICGRVREISFYAASRLLEKISKASLCFSFLTRTSICEYYSVDISLLRFILEVYYRCLRVSKRVRAVNRQSGNDPLRHILFIMPCQIWVSIALSSQLEKFEKWI